MPCRKLPILHLLFIFKEDHTTLLMISMYLKKILILNSSLRVAEMVYKREEMITNFPNEVYRIRNIENSFDHLMREGTQER